MPGKEPASKHYLSGFIRYSGEESFFLRPIDFLLNEVGSWYSWFMRKVACPR